VATEELRLRQSMVKNPVESMFYGVFAFIDLQNNHQNISGFSKLLAVHAEMQAEQHS
jgi:hypothetical protein